MKIKQIFLIMSVFLILIVLCACRKADKKTVENLSDVAVPVDSENTERLEDKQQDIPENGVTPEETLIETEYNPGEVFVGSAEVLEVAAEDLFKEYDNTVVSGFHVKAAINDFRNKRVAILVATHMVMDGTIALNKLDDNVPASMPTVGVIGMSGIINTLGEDMSDKFTLINYGAVLKGSNGKAEITFEGDHFVAKDGLDVDGDKYVVNTATENTAKDGMSENINDYLPMKSYLVKDSKGEIIGIVFYAVKTA